MRSNAVLTIHDAIARLFSTLHRRPAGHQMVMNAARANQSLKPPPTPTPTPMRSSSFTPARRTITTNMVFQRTLCTSPHLQKKQMPRRPVLDENDVTGSYLKGSGPGGQKINKTNSAVQLIHKPTGIVVKSQATRSQSQNRTIAMNILAEKIELLEKGKDSRAAIVAETKKKRIASNIKKRKRKYKKLADEKAATTEREEKLSGEHGNDGERGESVETPNHASEMNQSDNEGDDNITSPM